MPVAEDWSKDPNNEEFFIPFPDTKYNQRIRVRMIKKQRRGSKIKDVSTFSIGYELEINEKWYTIIRHCNYHEKDHAQFHIHNDHQLNLPLWGKHEKIKWKNQKRTPGSQMRWAIKNIRRNYGRYRVLFLIKEGKIK